MFILFLLCVFGLWLYYSYVSVTKKRDEAYDCFDRVDTELKKRYELITDIMSSAQSYLSQNQSLTDYISKLKDEVITLGRKPEFMNRRMALDKELENKSEQLIALIKGNSQLSSDKTIIDAINNYDKISSDISLAKQDFNTSAKIFRKAVDVFPSSFMARLNEIKSLDYMK